MPILYSTITKKANVFWPAVKTAALQMYGAMMKNVPKRAKARACAIWLLLYGKLICPSKSERIANEIKRLVRVFQFIHHLESDWMEK